jgi:hypothetical protein
MIFPGKKLLTLLKNNDASPLRHKDIFREYILPRMTESRVNWDNESDGEEGILSFQDCRSKCEATDDCRQFSVDCAGSGPTQDSAKRLRGRNLDG